MRVPAVEVLDAYGLIAVVLVPLRITGLDLPLHRRMLTGPVSTLRSLSDQPHYGF